MGQITSSPVFEMVIGMVLVWFLLASAASGVYELIAAVLRLRSKHLWNAVRRLLETATPDNPKAIGAASDMMTRPATLQAAAATPQASAGNDAGEQAKPTAFAKLIDLLPGVTPDNLKSVKGLSPGVLADGLLAIVEDPGKVSDFDNTPLGRYLSALPTTLKTDLEQRRRIIDRWVDGTMTSLSVTYRRNARYWLVGIGLLIVLPLGIDSVWLAKRLYSEPTLRAAAVTEAQNTVNSTKALADCESTAPANQRGATTTTTAPPSASRAEHLEACVRTDINTLDELRITAWNARGGPTVVAMLPGLLLSIGAVAMGAPFWFDLLRRLMGLRRTAASTSPTPTASP